MLSVVPLAQSYPEYQAPVQLAEGQQLSEMSPQFTYPE